MNHSAAHKRILVVEDDYFLAREMADAFVAAGASVIGPVPNAKAALDAVRREPVDAAVLDVRLEGGAVYEVADLLLARNVPFVFATGYGSMVPKRYERIAIYDKPVELRKLTKTVGELAANGAESVGISYSVRRTGKRWHWRVFDSGALVEQGSATTSVSARVEALLAAYRREEQ